MIETSSGKRSARIPARAGTCILVLGTCLSACSDEAPTDDEPLGRIASAVQGGTGTGLYPYAVGICTGESPAQCLFRCSGTLIAPNLVLTVRHCVFPAPRVHVDCKSDQFGVEPIATPGSYWVTTNASTWGAGAGWHQVQLFRAPTPTSVCGADLALLFLKSPVPAFEAAAATPGLADLTNKTEYSNAVTLIGHGETSPGEKDYGLRRIRQSNPIVCLPGDPSLECADLGTLFVDREFVATSKGCEGDSGAGAFEQRAFSEGRAVTIGVLSRSQTVNGQCERGIYQRLDRWKNFLAGGGRLASTLGGYPPPAWTNIPEAEDLGGLPNDFAPRTLGARCGTNADCDSGSCASKDGGFSFTCTQNCRSADGASCPAGFACLSGGGKELCFAEPPAPPRSNSTCSIHPAPHELNGLAIPALALFVLGIRRTSRPAPGRRRACGSSQRRV